MRRIAFYKMISFVRKAIPHFATYIATFGERRKLLWESYWNYFQQSLYGSFLGKLKLMVRLPDGHRALIRPFSQDDAIISEIFERRPYELSKPQVGDVVIDAGAHIGLFSIKASTFVGPDGLVISVEPLPANYSMLLQNIELNSMMNVIPIRAAVGEKDGLINLYFNKGQTVTSSICVASEKSVEVSSITLDRLVERLNINRVDLIKVDVEGAEYALLKGARKILERSKPVIMMEIHEHDGVREQVLGTLKEFGYSVMEKKMEGTHYLYGECQKNNTFFYQLP